MKQRILLSLALAIAFCSTAKAYKITLTNNTSDEVKINLGAVARPGSYHIALSPRQTKALDTWGYIPEWVSAYRYKGRWNDEKIIAEKQNADCGTRGRHDVMIVVYNNNSIQCFEGFPTNYDSIEKTDGNDF